MAVGSQLGKLAAPEGRPGSRLVPGVTEGDCGRKARNEGVSAGSQSEGGRRKSGAEGANVGGNLPNWHPCHALQKPKKPGKTDRSAAKIGCELGKLNVRENRRKLETAQDIGSRLTFWRLGRFN